MKTEPEDFKNYRLFRPESGVGLVSLKSKAVSRSMKYSASFIKTELKTANCKSATLIVFLILASCTLLFNVSCTPKTETLNSGVLVIGGTTSGISAGIQSAREGIPTVIIEETPWLGGMLTAAGVSATDGNHSLSSGLWNEFRNQLRMHYGGASALATGWVSNTQFEPHIGDSIFKAMAGKEKFLKVLHGFYPEEVLKSDNRVIGVLFRNERNERLKVLADITIDATDLGDGLAMAGASFDLGMESGKVTGEEWAPETPNTIVQDLTWVAILKDYGAGTDRSIPRPRGYDPEKFRGSCAMTVDSVLIDCRKMLDYGRLPRNKYMINWPRKGNDYYVNVVETDREERIKQLEGAKQQTLEFVHYIQTELGFRNLGLADDEFPTQDRLALVPYHREGRRLKGIERMTLNHALRKHEVSPLYRTGISVGDYPVDHHHACKEDAPKIKFPPIPSFNIPAGALIPEVIDGLIVADKAISVSNLMNGSTRLQPCVLLTGQAAGAMAAICVKEKIQPREINIRKLQQLLLENNAYLMPLYDVHPEDPDFQAVQRVTSCGILPVKGEPYQWANRTWFYPDSHITVGDFSSGMHDFDPSFPVQPDSSVLTRAVAGQLVTDYLSKTRPGEVAPFEAYLKDNLSGPEKSISRRELSLLIDRWIRPFEMKEIGFDGYYKHK